MGRETVGLAYHWRKRVVTQSAPVIADMPNRSLAVGSLRIACYFVAPVIECAAGVPSVAQ